MHSFECKYCDMKFALEYRLKRHLRSHEANGQIHTFECAVCGKIFEKRRTIYSHIKRSHGESRFECKYCGNKFTLKYLLTRHLRSHQFNETTTSQIDLQECAICEKKLKNRDSLQKHIKIHSEKKFECNRCGNKFALKYNLTRHLRSHEANNTTSLQIDTFECAICEKKLKNRDSLQKHIKIHGEKKFECNHCGNKFALKYNLTRHLRSHEANKTTTLQINTFECAICEKTFKKRNLLQKHSRIHNEKKFECYRCGDKFAFKYNLKRHLCSHKTPITEHGNSYKCGFCFSCFRSKKEIRRHFETDHKIILRCKQLHFNSEEDFKKFKLDYQRKTITQFIIRNGWKSTDGISKLYKCHRSGLYKAKGGFEKFPKMNDLKKIQSYCPAEMYVKLFEDGKCVVDFQESHVGHNVGDQSELCYINLDSSEREQITAKVQLGVSKNIIRVDQVLTSQEKEDGNRLRMVHNQDIHKLSAVYGIQNQYVLAFGDDLIDVNAFAQIYATSVLFYKKQFEEDTRFNVLANDDFTLVFMNEFQEKNLCRYGNNIIAFDGAQGTKKYDFILHTLLIMDINYEGVPVAFIISNRNDVTTINIFLRCIKDRVGILTPRVIMTDMQPTYKNSWVKIMQNVPEFTFWCTHHVRDEWQKNCWKIADKGRREEVKRMVLDFVYELNPVLFHCKLDSFLSMDDMDLEPFITYFQQYFVEDEKSQMWAYCYRKEAGINTNMSLESFHRSFKYNYCKRKKMNWLSSTLFSIHQFLSVENITEEMTFYVGVRKNKLNMIRQKHHEAQEKDVTNKIYVIDPNSWLVESFKKPDVMYVVERISIKECVQYDDAICGILCDLCKCCFHEYSCNCPDAVICNNMCEHIHAVGILQNSSKTHVTNQLAEDNSVTVMTKPETPMFGNFLTTNEFSQELEQVEKTVQLQTNQIENMIFEKKKQDLLNWLEDVFEKVPNLEILLEIEKRFLKPIIPTIHDFTPKVEF